MMDVIYFVVVAGLAIAAVKWVFVGAPSGVGVNGISGGVNPR